MPISIVVLVSSVALARALIASRASGRHLAAVSAYRTKLCDLAGEITSASRPEQPAEALRMLKIAGEIFKYLDDVSFGDMMASVYSFDRMMKSLFKFKLESMVVDQELFDLIHGDDEGGPAPSF